MLVRILRPLSVQMFELLCIQNLQTLNPRPSWGVRTASLKLVGPLSNILRERAQVQHRELTPEGPHRCSTLWPSRDGGGRVSGGRAENISKLHYRAKGEALAGPETLSTPKLEARVTRSASGVASEGR